MALPAKKLSQKDILGVLNTGDEFYVISGGLGYRIESSVARQYMLDGIDPLIIQGNWNASTNTPTLADGVGDIGNFYITNVAGTQDLGSGNISFAVGDWIIYTASNIWIKSLNSLPALTDTEIAFGDVANQLSSSSSFIWNDSTKVLTVFGAANIFGALAAGNANTASGSNSQAFGTGNTSNASNATSFGDSNTASGVNALVTGNNNAASGDQSAIFGKDGVVSADNALGIGEGVAVQSYASIGVGRFSVLEGTPASWVATDPAIVVGDGTNGGARSNVVKIQKNGQTILGGNTIDASLMLDVVSTNKASRPNPPMTTAQKNAIVSPKAGFAVYDTTLNKDSTYNGTIWYNGEVIASEVENTPAGNISATDVQAAINELDSSKLETSLKGANSGLAELNSSGRLPETQLTENAMQYKGSWNASTNTPTLADFTGTEGDVYRVNVAGTQDLGSGSVSYKIGDWVLYSNVLWTKSLNSLPVLADTQVSFGNASNEPIGSADFIWDDTGKKLTLNGDILTKGNLAVGTGNNLNGATDSAGIGTAAFMTSTYSLAVGNASNVSGDRSVAIGFSAEHKADNSLSVGHELQNQSYGSVVVGQFNVLNKGTATSWIGTDPAITVGNGLSNAARANSFIIHKDGRMVVGSGSAPFQLALDVQSPDNSKVSRPWPIMTTTQKNATNFPVEGYTVYDTTLNALSIYNGTSWKEVAFV